MKKPDGYDEAKASGEFTPAEVGGHYAVIKQVAERQSSTGKDMVVVLFDFCKPDKQEGYFAEQFNSSDKEDKKWPFAGTKYVMVNDYLDPNKTSRAFKTFCTCVEKSNDMQVSWGGNNWGQQFKGKKIGVVFGAEEQEYNGRISMRHIPKWFCDYAKVKDQKAPDPVYLNGSSPASSTNTAQSSQAKANSDGFMNIPDDADIDEIPF